MLLNYIYRTLTVLLLLWLIITAVLDCLHMPTATELLRQLGYPAYMAVIIGVCKVVAISILLYPRTRLLREWTYAGIFFILVGSTVSHEMAHMPTAETLRPVIVLLVLVGSYLARPEELRLRAGDHRW